MNKNYDVSFEVVSKKDSLFEISRRIGLRPSYGSCDHGELKGGEKANYAWFRWFTNLHGEVPLEKHLRILVKKINKTEALKKRVLKAEYKKTISIARYIDKYKTWAPVLILPEWFLKWVGENRLSLEFVVYPSKIEFVSKKTKKA